MNSGTLDAGTADRPAKKPKFEEVVEDAFAHHLALIKKDVWAMTADQKQAHRQQVDDSERFLRILQQQQQQASTSTGTTSTAVQGEDGDFLAGDAQRLSDQFRSAMDLTQSSFRRL